MKGYLRILLIVCLLSATCLVSPGQSAQARPRISPPVVTLSLVENITPGNTGTSTAGEAVLGNAVYFSLEDGSHGYELWKSDGTPAGTDIVKDIQAGANSGFPYNLVAVGSHLFFQADDGTNGTEPWVSDGTETGTHLIHDVNPGANSSGLYKPALLGGDILFAGSDAGNAPPDKGVELWKSSSPFTSAALVKDINTDSDGVDGSYPDYFFTFNENVYFKARGAGLVGEELWRSDGSAGGTVLVKDIRADGDSSVFGFTEFNGAMFFQADDGIHGAELWKSDGSTGGTQMLLDIFPGDDGNLPPTPNNSLPNFIASIGNSLFFTAFDGTHGNELWKTDGTLAGTELVKDIRSGSASSFLNTDTSFSIVVNDQLIFLARDNAHGLELWKSDGTEAGTTLLAELNPSGDANVYFSAKMNGLAYFVADIGDGMEIWQTDGTPAGTLPLTNINSAGETIYGLYPVNGDLLFWYDDGSHGQELWKAGIHPGINSIVRTGANPASSATVDFVVTFSEPVKDVDTADFVLTTNGVAGAGVSAVNGSGNTRTVTVNTGSGDGTIRLDIPNTATIKDLGDNPMSGLPFTSGETYTVEKNAAPTDISLSASSLTENLPAGTTVGILASTDPDTGDTITFSLVTGAGSDNNTSFTINGNTLKSAHPFNFASKSSYSIRMRATDNGGLFFEKVFTISILNAPAIFTDVPETHWAASFIERLFNAGITGGCTTSPLGYCPDNPVTRAQMAIFLEKGIHGPGFTPANVAATFTDTVGHFAEDWIEALKNDGVTSGCGAGIYCPESAVTRAQMAVFLLKAKYGASYSPPNVSPTFGDTAGHFAEDWIEQLATEGITSGCGGGNYCPENSVTRDQMAVFLVKAFGLP